MERLTSDNPKQGQSVSRSAPPLTHPFIRWSARAAKSFFAARDKAGSLVLAASMGRRIHEQFHLPSASLWPRNFGKPAALIFRAVAWWSYRT